MALSLPKQKIRLLLLEGVNEFGRPPVRGQRLCRDRALAEGAGCRGAEAGARGRAHARHPLADATYGRRARGRRPADGGRLLFRRHQPGRPRRRAAARHSRVQRALLQHPQRRGADHRRSRHAAAPGVSALRRRACGRLGQIGRRQPRGARQDARHRRLRQYRFATVEPRRSHGHARDLFRPHRQAPSRQHRAGRDARRTAGGRATWSRCTCRRRRRPPT